MATYTTPIRIKKGGRVQVFAHHGALAALPDALTLAAGDILDVEGSLGRSASHCKVIMRGSVDVTITFNEPQYVVQRVEGELDQRVELPVGSSGICNLRLLNTSGTQVFDFDDLGIASIVIVDISAASTTNFVEFIVW